MINIHMLCWMYGKTRLDARERERERERECVNETFRVLSFYFYIKRVIKRKWIPSCFFPHAVPPALFLSLRLIQRKINKSVKIMAKHVKREKHVSLVFFIVLLLRTCLLFALLFHLTFLIFMLFFLGATTILS